jgi:hypothetical protein
MGYRHYFYAIPKKQIEGIRNCKTNEEFCTWAEKAGYEVEREEDEEPWVTVYHLGREIYEFGKYVDWAFDMQNKNESIFTYDELKERYSDYDPVICSKDDFLAAIDNYKQKIISYLEGCLEEEEGSTSEQKCVRDVKDRLYEWKNPYKYAAVDINDDRSCITTSWLYEYAIFELVRKYKTFDWENDCLVLLGW